MFSFADLASLGSFISGVAVMVSLPFLYFQLRQVTEQVRQAEKNQRSAMRAMRATRMIDSVTQAADASIADAFTLGNFADSSISDTQIRQFTHFTLGRFVNLEDSFYQHRDGLLDADAFATVVRNLRGSLTMPGSRVAYRKLRGWFAPEFLAFADAILAETPIAMAGTAAENSANWRADLAAERARTGSAPTMEPA